jgi:hypothetical protein
MIFLVAVVYFRGGMQQSRSENAIAVGMTRGCGMVLQLWPPAGFLVLSVTNVIHAIIIPIV